MKIKILKKKTAMLAMIFVLVGISVLGVASVSAVETGSITVCKIIIDKNNNITDGAENTGTFIVPPSTIDQPLPATTFSTPLNLNSDIIGNDSINDAECVVYSGISIDSYSYGQEQTTGSNWLTPLYNDQYTSPVNNLTDFFPYSDELFTSTTTDDATRNQNADGHITLTPSKPNRTLVILNKYELPEPICGNGILEPTEQCDDSNTENGDGCGNTCQLESLICEDIESKTGWYGSYFNYFASHPDMNLLNTLWPDKTHNDPLNTSWNTDWYTQPYFRFSRVDQTLMFGDNFFPFDIAKEEETNGHDYHFGAHWQAKATVATSGDYQYTLTSDDDAWVYVDGVLQVDNSGIHAPTTQTGTLSLTDEHIIDVFFAERHTSRSSLSFNIEGATLTPYNEECEEQTGTITVCKIIIDGEGNVTDGEENTGSFSIPGISRPADPNFIAVLPTSVFTTPLVLNADLLLDDGINDAQCITYDNLELGTYYHGEEVISGDNWLTPLYNDQYTHPVNDLTDFFPFSGEDVNTDGCVGISEPNWLSRTIVVLNQYASVCGNNILETGEQCDDGNTDNGDGCSSTCQVEITPPPSVTKCSDALDNDTDGKIDAQDPACWNDPTDPGTYNPTKDNENERPVITLIGDNPAVIMVGEGFNDSGATAQDPEDGDITGDIVVSGDTTIDGSTAGVYTINYNVVDSQGLAAETKARTVKVKGTPIGGCVGSCGTPTFPTPTTTPQTTTTPEVLGTSTPAVCNYLLEYLRINQSNNPNEVRKLQAFLKYFEGEDSLEVSGFFGQNTFNAVSRFQLKYAEDVLTPWGLNMSTGYVYITTKKKVNEIYCRRDFPLTEEQQREIEIYSAGTQKPGPEQGITQGNTELDRISEVVTEITSSVALLKNEIKREGIVKGTETSEQDKTELNIAIGELLQKEMENTDENSYLVKLVAGVGGTTILSFVSWIGVILGIFIILFVPLYYRRKDKKVEKKAEFTITQRQPILENLHDSTPVE